jgi:hypothetical protein
MLFSFYLSSIIIKNKYLYYDTKVDDELEQNMIENSKIFMFEYNYLDELEELTDNSDFVIDKSNITTLEIPFLNNKIIMYYDTDKDAFCYYTKGDVIYKYLNVACRKYVIEHNCKQLYKGIEDAKQSITNKVKFETNNTFFIKKTDKPNNELIKNINKFILVGSLEDYENSLITTSHKELSYKDYLIIQQELITTLVS